MTFLFFSFSYIHQLGYNKNKIPQPVLFKKSVASYVIESAIEYSRIVFDLFLPEFSQ
eukprot:Pgem_evm1s17597